MKKVKEKLKPTYVNAQQGRLAMEGSRSSNPQGVQEEVVQMEVSAQGLAEVVKSQGPIPFGMMRREDGLIVPRLSREEVQEGWDALSPVSSELGGTTLPTEFFQLDNQGEM